MRTELYWIEGPWRGRLAIMPRPRGGDWLEDEITAWKSMGIDTVVSALTREEIADLELASEAALCEKAGIEFIAFPILDRGVPASMKATMELVRRLEPELAAGRKIAIHCRQGIGRASLLAACILAVGGVELASALDRIAAARGCAVPETSEQREWVARFVRDMLTAGSGDTSTTSVRVMESPGSGRP